MKLVKVGIVGVLLTAAYFKFMQVYNKAKNSTLSFSRLKLNKLSDNAFIFDVFVDFLNTSDIDLKMKSQIYDVYFNGVPVLHIQDNVPRVLKIDSISELKLTCSFNPTAFFKTIGTNYMQLLLNGSSVTIKIKLRLKFTALFINFDIPYEYDLTVADLIKTQF